MSAPVINLTTSVLGYQQWQAWTYQPWATGLVGGGGDTWTSSPLPAGMSLDAGTGAISGAASQAGVYIVGLQVSNTNGASAPVYLTIGIEPAANSNHSGLDVKVDVGTGLVTLPANCMIKEDDDLLLYITFVRDGNVIDLGVITALNLTLKEFEPDASLLVGDTFGKTGTGTTAVYILYAKLESDALKSSMSNYEEDAGTTFNALAEIEWIEPNVTSGPIGPTTLRRSSGLFTLPIYRNLLPD